MQNKTKMGKHSLNPYTKKFCLNQYNLFFTKNKLDFISYLSALDNLNILTFIHYQKTTKKCAQTSEIPKTSYNVTHSYIHS
jgi:hypothetical protein